MIVLSEPMDFIVKHQQDIIEFAVTGALKKPIEIQGDKVD